jgi:hypothetical protein
LQRRHGAIADQFHLRGGFLGGDIHGRFPFLEQATCRGVSDQSYV